VLTLVVLVPEVGAPHSDHAAGHHEAVPAEGGVVEDEVLNGIPLFFFHHTDPNCDYPTIDYDRFDGPIPSEEKCYTS